MRLPCARAISACPRGRCDLPETGNQARCSRRRTRALADRRAVGGNWQASEQLYRRAIAAGDSSGIAGNNLAVLLSRHGKPDEAVAMASQVIRQFPNIANFRDTLADIQRTQGKFDAAAANEQKAISLQPAEAKWRITYAELLLASGDSSAAGKAFSDWVDLRQTLPADSPLAVRVAHLQSQLKPGPSPNSDNPL